MHEIQNTRNIFEESLLNHTSHMWQGATSMDRPDVEDSQEVLLEGTAPRPRGLRSKSEQAGRKAQLLYPWNDISELMEIGPQQRHQRPTANPDMRCHFLLHSGNSEKRTWKKENEKEVKRNFQSFSVFLRKRSQHVERWQASLGQGLSPEVHFQGNTAPQKT